MGKNSKGIIAALLCLILPAAFAGCAKDGGKNTGSAVTDISSAIGDASSLNGENGGAGNEIENNNSSMQDTEPVKAGIDVPRISGLDKDFICGVDISSIKSEYESGVKYYNFKGNALAYSPGECEKGFFAFLKECGINWVRIRVWNDPYDEKGNSYGGGNNDLETAADIGKLATDAGLRVFIDFHYSDFWSGQGKFQTPKAWQDMDIDSKAQALEMYTIESLTKLIDNGVDVGMVQIGNEIVNGLAGETEWDNICQLMNEGSKAVRYVADTMEKEILVALHFTNISEITYRNIASILEDRQVDYDVFATSYYPFWHGTVENMAAIMKMIAEEYGKKVMVAETSYVYTLEDGDGQEQSVGKDSSLPLDYDVSIQGQADAFASVIQAMADAGEAGIGVFYWEPAWIPVQLYNKNMKKHKKILRENKKIWEEKGSGWASRAAGSYDADGSGKWHGGSLWDNQALFDFEGHPSEPLMVFKYVFTGAVKK